MMHMNCSRWQRPQMRGPHLSREYVRVVYHRLSPKLSFALFALYRKNRKGRQSLCIVEIMQQCAWCEILELEQFVPLPKCVVQAAQLPNFAIWAADYLHILVRNGILHIWTAQERHKSICCIKSSSISLSLSQRELLFIMLTRKLALVSALAFTHVAFTSAKYAIRTLYYDSEKYYTNIIIGDPAQTFLVALDTDRYALCKRTSRLSLN